MKVEDCYDVLKRLKNGEKIKCPECGKAYLELSGNIPEKAHAFHCPNCDYHYHYTFDIGID